MSQLFQNLPNIISDVLSNTLSKISYQSWLLSAVIAAIIFAAIFAMALLSRRSKTKEQAVNQLKNDAVHGGVKQGRQYRFQEDLSSVYQSPTSKEELDFIISSGSEHPVLNTTVSHPVAAVSSLDLKLLQYVRDARNFGMNDQMIAQELRKVGWDDNSVNSALKLE